MVLSCCKYQGPCTTTFSMKTQGSLTPQLLNAMLLVPWQTAQSLAYPSLCCWMLACISWGAWLSPNPRPFKPQIRPTGQETRPLSVSSSMGWEVAASQAMRVGGGGLKKSALPHPLQATASISQLGAWCGSRRATREGWSVQAPTLSSGKASTATPNSHLGTWCSSGRGLKGWRE